MTDVAPETDVEALVATAERMVRSFRGQPQNLDQLACNEVASLIDRLRSLLLRAEEEREALREALVWVSDNYPKAMREMPTHLFRPLTRCATPEETKEAAQA